MNATRRNFLKGALAAAGLGIAGPVIYVKAHESHPGTAHPAAASSGAAEAGKSAGVSASATASPVPAEKQTKSLVVIQLAGGNDGLATVLPYADPALKRNRTNLLFPDDQLLKLNNELALHPNMKGLKQLFDEGKVSIVQGVGYPDPNRSHFASMDIWASASPGKISDTGWIGRFLDAAGLPPDNPFNAVAVGGAIPFAMKGHKVATPVIQNIQAFSLKTDPRHPQDHQQLMAAFTQIYQRGPGGVPYYALVDKIEANTVQAVSSVKDIATKYHPATSYPQTPLGLALQNVAALMTGGFGTKVYYASSGGFDTHAAEKVVHDRLMSEISDAVSAFYKDLEAHNLAQNVVMMTWSEFGRRVKENGSGGTDHGTAAPMFVIGDPVKGGIVGDPPSLSKLDKNGDLVFGIDFRSVYNTVLSKWMGMDGQEVLGSKFDLLPIFK